MKELIEDPDMVEMLFSLRSSINLSLLWVPNSFRSALLRSNPMLNISSEIADRLKEKSLACDLVVKKSDKIISPI